MSEIRDRALEEITKKLEDFYAQCLRRNEDLTVGDEAFDWADAILSIPELAIVDREAELPKNTFGMCDKLLWATYETAQQDILKDGWVKEVKDDRTKRQNHRHPDRAHHHTMS